MASETLSAPQLQQYVADFDSDASPDAERVRSTAAHVFALAMRGPGELLEALRNVLDVSLRTDPTQSKAEKLEIMHLLHLLDLRRAIALEEADPTRMAKVAVAAEHLARKAQSGFAKPSALKAPRRRAA